MPAESEKTKEEWAEIRRASEIGVKDEVLSQEYGISRLAIRLRRCREKWISAERIEKELQEKHEQRNGLKRGAIETGLKQTPKSALELTAESLSERGAAYSLNIFNKVSKLASQSVEILPTPDNWKSFAIADQIARRAAGLDRPQNQAISVNLAMFSSPAGEADQQGWRVVNEQDATDPADES